MGKPSFGRKAKTLQGNRVAERKDYERTGCRRVCTRGVSKKFGDGGARETSPTKGEKKRTQQEEERGEQTEEKTGTTRNDIIRPAVRAKNRPKNGKRYENIGSA